ncbi:Polygalacturonase qrt3 [Thalictrum thalictroides]|uniref:Polygalacturonase qrt3 n=1 Tax=Thalictrum thalictroides TaxID=46969 RepID=A0A7J6V0H1_THATH|nr:Polygalacturonase qrt3 [Thalictrum thalictroides]
MRAPIAVLCVFLVIFCQEAFCSFSPPSSKSREYYAKFKKIIAAKSKPLVTLQANGLKQDGRVFYPIGYGADPTGAKDSSAAILNALADAFKVSSGLELLRGVHDLGGAVIDLQGASYKIDHPIRLPAQGGGNVVIKSGSLRASSLFPGNRHLIEIWSPSSQNTVGFYYEDITFHDILFDSSFRGGGIYVIDSVRIRIDNCFFIHFSTQGIVVERGHETLVSNTFLGQYLTVGGDKREKSFTGTGIKLASNDNVITDVVIFSAAIGLAISGQANMITGVHCYNKATYWGGIGILVDLPGNSQTRIDNCYLDYNAIVLKDPVQVHVSNVYFLGDGNIVLKSVKGQISGLNIVDNMFTGNAKANAPIVKLDGVFSNIDQVVVDRNTVNGMALKSTIGKSTIKGNGTKWTTDFSQVLLFPNKINHVQYSFYVRGRSGIPAHAVTNVTGNFVTVESDKAVDGVVSVEVDQYNRGGEISLYN